MVRFNKDENNRRTIVRTNNGPLVTSTPNTPQRNISNRNENSGYNSDDERRPRSIVKKIDDEGVKHVTVEQLKAKLAQKGLEIVTMPPDGNCYFILWPTKFMGTMNIMMWFEGYALITWKKKEVISPNL